MLDDIRLVDELRQVGVHVQSVFDLVNSSKAYPEAIDLLVRELPTVRDPMIKEGVVRALTVKEARDKAEVVLIREFERISSTSDESEQLLKWSIGNALAVVSSPNYGAKLLQLATNKAHGAARQMIVSVLWRFNLPGSDVSLIKLLEDDSVAAFAAQALGRIGGSRARDALEGASRHPNAFIRKEIGKAINRIDGKRRTQ